MQQRIIEQPDRIEARGGCRRERAADARRPNDVSRGIGMAYHPRRTRSIAPAETAADTAATRDATRVELTDESAPPFARMNR